MKLFGIFRSDNTGIKILITNHLGKVEVKTVYDCGNGAWIKTTLGDPRYLAKNGDFELPYDQCQGDAVSWRPHSGDVTKLNILT